MAFRQPVEVANAPIFMISDRAIEIYDELAEVALGTSGDRLMGSLASVLAAADTVRARSRRLG